MQASGPAELASVPDRMSPGARNRHRGVQFALLLLIVLLGLASRRYASILPPVISRYAGDTLWATAVFVAAGFIWPAARTRWLALGAAVVSLAVELSQLAHPAWLEAVRRWPGVGLLLGYDFVASDLACYAVGVILGVALDQIHRRGGPTRAPLSGSARRALPECLSPPAREKG